MVSCCSGLLSCALRHGLSCGSCHSDVFILKYASVPGILGVVVVNVKSDPVNEMAFVKVQHLSDFADTHLHGLACHLFVLELAFEEGTGGQRAVVLRWHFVCFFLFFRCLLGMFFILFFHSFFEGL